MNLNFARSLDRWVGLAICLVLFAFERIFGPLMGRHIPPFLATTPPSADAPVPRPRRILCMKFYGLGNAVMLFPVLASVRQRFPDAELDFLTMVGNLDLLERSQTVTHTLGVDTSSLGSFVRSMATALRFIRQRQYDSVLDFEQFIKISTIIAFLSGARERIGFNTDGQRRGFMYTRRVVYTDSDHQSAIFARLTHALGVTDSLPAVTLRLETSERQRVRDFLAQVGVAAEHFPLVVVHVGTGGNFYRIPVKRWDPSNFGTVADGLVERYGAAIVFTGQGKEEQALVAETRASMRHTSVDATNRFSVCELAALVERAHFVLCTDTSVMHLATLMGTPVAALFGPTSPLQYGPRGRALCRSTRD